MVKLAEVHSARTSSYIHQYCHSHSNGTQVNQSICFVLKRFFSLRLQWYCILYIYRKHSTDKIHRITFKSIDSPAKYTWYINVSACTYMENTPLSQLQCFQQVLYERSHVQLQIKCLKVAVQQNQHPKNEFFHGEKEYDHLKTFWQGAISL